MPPMNDGEISHLIDLKRRNPVGKEDVRRNADSGDPFKLKLYGSDHTVRLPFKALDDLGNDLRRAGASHGEVDQRLIPWNRAELPGNRKFVLGMRGPMK